MINSDSSKNSDIKKLAQGAGLSIAGKVAGRLLSIAGDIFAARILGAGMFGLYSIGWTLIRIVGLIVPLGLPQGVINYIPKYEKNQSFLKGIILSSIFLSFISGGTVGTLFYIIAPWMAESLFNKPQLTEIFRLFSLAFPVISLLSVSSAVSRSTQHMKYTVIIEDVGQPLLGLIVVVLIYFFVGPWLPGIILSDIISFAGMGLLGLVIVRRMYHTILNSSIKPEYSILCNVLAFSFPTSLAGIFTVFVFWVDRLIVGILLSPVENGVYQAISQLSVIFVVLNAAFNAILTPMFANLFAKKEIARMEEVFRIGTKWSFYLSICPFIIFMLFPKEILVMVFGADYSAGWGALMILALGQLINSATGSIGALLVMTGYQKTWFWLSMSTFLANTILCALLTSRMGILGAATGTAITVSGMNLLAIYAGKRYLGVWPYDRRYIKGILAGLIAFLCGLAFKTFPLSSFTLLFGGVFVLSLVFFIGLYMSNFDSEDYLLIAMVEARLGVQIPFLKKEYVNNDGPT